MGSDENLRADHEYHSIYLEARERMIITFS